MANEHSTLTFQTSPAVSRRHSPPHFLALHMEDVPLAILAPSRRKALARESLSIKGCDGAPAHHDGEDDGGHGGLEHPEEGQAQGLDEGEEVDAALGHVAQVDQVRLVLGGHQQQLQTVHELERRHP